MIGTALRRVAYLLVLAALLVAVPSAAEARFVRSAAGSTAVSTDVLSAPGNVSVTRQCGFLSPNVSVSWTATPDQYATGYTVTLTRSGGGGTSTTTVSGRATTNATISIGYYTSATFIVTATYRSWTSPQTSSTLAVQCGYFN